MAENKVKTVTKIASFLDCEKSFQNIETILNDLMSRINSKAESDIKEEEGETGDTKITQNADKSFSLEVRTKEGWKKGTVKGMPVRYGEKPKDETSIPKKSIDEIEAADTSTGTEDAKKTIFDEKADKFVLPRPDYDSGWVVANNTTTTAITHNLELTKEPALYQLYISQVQSPVIGTNSLIGEYTLNNGNGSGSVDFYSANVVNIHIGHDRIYHPGTSFGSSNVPSDFVSGFIKIKIWK